MAQMTAGAPVDGHGQLADEISRGRAESDAHR